MCAAGGIGSGVWISLRPYKVHDRVTVSSLSIARTLFTCHSRQETQLLHLKDLFGFSLFSSFSKFEYLIAPLPNLHIKVMVPVALYVSIELVKLGQVYFINQDLG